MTAMQTQGLVVLSHPPEWHARREGKFTGSPASPLMRGELTEVYDGMTGGGKDLSGVILPTMGTTLQPLIAHHYELQTGTPITEYEAWKVHPEIEWMACNQDGRAGDRMAEIKFTTGRKSLPELVESYMGQLVHNTIIAQATDPAITGWVLIVLTGWGALQIQEGAVDPFYADILMEREEAMMECIKAGARPGDGIVVAAPVPQSEWRTVDMTGSNEWASLATDWLGNKSAAAKFDKAGKGIKELIEPDVGEAGGYGLKVKRAKNNSLRISEVKS
jgi:hypothetical protein